MVFCDSSPTGLRQIPNLGPESPGEHVQNPHSWAKAQTQWKPQCRVTEGKISLNPSYNMERGRDCPTAKSLFWILTYSLPWLLQQHPAWPSYLNSCSPLINSLLWQADVSKTKIRQCCSSTQIYQGVFPLLERERWNRHAFPYSSC